MSAVRYGFGGAEVRVVGVAEPSLKP
jgi:hypothetical protein